MDINQFDTALLTNVINPLVLKQQAVTYSQEILIVCTK